VQGQLLLGLGWSGEAGEHRIHTYRGTIKGLGVSMDCMCDPQRQEADFAAMILACNRRSAPRRQLTSHTVTSDCLGRR
jgi:hypothetical protein